MYQKICMPGRLSAAQGPPHLKNVGDPARMVIVTRSVVRLRLLDPNVSSTVYATAATSRARRSGHDQAGPSVYGGLEGTGGNRVLVLPRLAACAMRRGRSESGKDRARTTGSAARPRTAASDGTSIFLPIFDQSQIVVIDLKAGRRRWSFQAKGWIYGEPTVTDDRVFLPQSKVTSTAIYSAPLCTDAAVYFGSFDGHLYCLKTDGGQLKWRIQPEEGSEITNSPLTDGRRIVVAVRPGSQKVGRDAVVVIAEEQGKR
jgi:outer membrane protein assembly factor BamB